MGTSCNYFDYRAPAYLADGSERRMHPDADIGTPLAKLFSGNCDNKEYYFGFKDTTDMCTWFTYREIFKLIDGGFLLLKIVVPTQYIVFGSRQLVFRKADIISKENILKHFMCKI